MPAIDLSPERLAIVAEARTWLGTPFRHQGRAKGAGVDCAGLVVGVAKALHLSEFDAIGTCDPCSAMPRARATSC